MKNTFVIVMFLFWGFVATIISAGYVSRENRLAQEAMQKVYNDILSQAIQDLKKAKQQVSATPLSTTTTTKPITQAGAPSVARPFVVTPVSVPSTSALTLSTVALHATESDCWIVISGKVYAVTSYIPMHPGGRRRIINECGGDATDAFIGAGHSSRAYALLGGYLVGTLQ